MIIECPACATRYVVPDNAIGVDGRTVRCAKCRNSWFQDGPVLDLADQPAAEPAAAPTPEPEQPAAPPAKEVEKVADVQPPISEEPIRPPVVEPISAPEPEISQFDAQPPFRPRRNWLKLWTWAAGIFAIFAAGIIFSVSYWGLPDWVPVSRPDFAVGAPDLQLDFPLDQQEKREMPNGIEYFAVNGTITNIGSSAQDVPPILIVLRDSRDRKVFEWEVIPDQRNLGPGESVSVIEAVLDVPRSARVAEIGWKAE